MRPFEKVAERAVLRPRTAISSSAKKGLHFRADEAPVTGEPPDKSLDQVIQRHVVIARYDDDRAGQFFEEGAGGSKLPLSRTLRQIAGDDDEVWADLG